MIPTSEEYNRHKLLSDLVLAKTATDQLAHDFLHIERVYHWCLRLTAAIDGNQDLAGACALVHDLVHIPKNHPDRPLGGERSAEAAGTLLTEAGYNTQEIEAIVEAVRTCSWSRGLQPTSELGKVLQDADRLDGMGAVGIARVFACAQEMCGPDSAFYHQADPLAVTDRETDDRIYAVDHFQRKLMKLAVGMHYPLAQEEAQRRHVFMEQFLWSLGAELHLESAQDAQAQPDLPERAAK